MALSETSLKAAAAYIVKGRLPPASPIGHLPPECQPADAADSMAIQDAVHESLTANGHGNVTGTKIGCTTQVMQDFLGMTHPCAGAIFDATVRHGIGEFEFDSFLHVGVECEIAVRLESPIRAAAAPHSMETVSAAVAAVYPAIEIVDDRYVDFVAREPDWRTWLADDFFGAGIVLGEPITEWRRLDLAAVHGSMSISGVEVGTGHGRDIINGHPLEALAWLANAEAVRGRDLPADWIVMLGSIVQTKWVGKNDVVAVEIGELGQASARFT
ncbi:MAG: fumarylacetoacetate hydrolase family protein [Lentisphaeria bacterium]|jgi:2-oxo-3-hexenedioate decarboxylase/2-keto-4-pentenoate hydratase|nr:fumarylacetoacetate hydrolase family protein [Lentisphaeria bacterium]